MLTMRMESGREAKFYRLTRKGRAQLETEAASWQRLTGAVGLIAKPGWPTNRVLKM